VEARQLASPLIALAAGVCTAALSSLVGTAPAQAQAQPNIVFIMGDDVGWSNIGAYNQGIMSGRTPNLDRLA
jgi:arylsulfatase